MERPHKVILVAFLSLMVGCFQSSAIDLNPPHDVLTLEILIDAHKVMKEAELQALEQISANEVEQSLITKSTKAFNEAKTVINSKMKDANSYLLLASSIVSCSLSLKKAINEYAAFTKNSLKYTSESKLSAAYYADANYQIGKEVKHVSTTIGTMTASGLNILKASNDEKVKLLFIVKQSINEIRDIIYHADLMMRTLIRTGYDVMYIQDILTSDLCNDISKKLTDEWNKQ